MAESSTSQFAEFVGQTVRLDDETDVTGGFDVIAAEVASGAEPRSPSLAVGPLAGVGILAGALLVALLPGPESVGGSFWRVGTEAARAVLGAAEVATLPLLCVGMVALVIGLIVATRDCLAVTEPTLPTIVVGGGGVVVGAVPWAAVALLGALNFLVALLIAVAIVIGTIFAVAFVGAMLLGMLSS